VTVFVIRDGRVIEKGSFDAAMSDRRSIFPSPMVSRMTPFESPVDGRDITTWRERDADMKRVNACDPRDLPRGPFEKRKADNARRAALPD
jgi:hypothetical protein